MNSITYLIYFQLVEYLTNDFLVIEMWGRQVATTEPLPNTASQSTKQLIAHDQTSTTGVYVSISYPLLLISG